MTKADEMLLNAKTAEETRKALAAGADVNAKDKDNDNKTPLMYANTAEQAQLLIDAGADVNGKVTHFLSDFDIKLCNRGGDHYPESVCKNHYYTHSLLDATCRFSIADPDIVKMLLDAGADPNYRNYNGSTPLMAMCMAGKLKHLQIVEMLIKAGAEVNATNSIGKTALDECVDDDTSAMAEILLKHGAKHGNEL